LLNKEDNIIQNCFKLYNFFTKKSYQEYYQNLNNYNILNNNYENYVKHNDYIQINDLDCIINCINNNIILSNKNIFTKNNLISFTTSILNNNYDIFNNNNNLYEIINNTTLILNYYSYNKLYDYYSVLINKLNIELFIKNMMILNINIISSILYLLYIYRYDEILKYLKEI
jgi:hypothetical protein